MDPALAANSAPSGLTFNRSGDDVLAIRLEGDWTFKGRLPSIDPVLKEMQSGIRRVTFDTGDLGDWDSNLLTFLLKVIGQAEERKIDTDRESLPDGVQKLLALATAVPERRGARRDVMREIFFAMGGDCSMLLM